MPSSAWKTEVCSRSEEHTSELQSLTNLACRLLLEKKHRGDQADPGHGGILRARRPRGETRRRRVEADAWLPSRSWPRIRVDFFFNGKRTRRVPLPSRTAPLPI